MIIVNYKNYAKGKEVLDISKKIEKINKKTIVCVPLLNIKEVVEKTKLEVYAQNADFIEGDKTTGFNLIESLKKSGALGILINHSEHPVGIKDIKKIIELSKKYKLKTLVFASNIRIVKKLIKMNPYAIAFEEPKLISTGKSITRYDSKDIKKFVSLLSDKKIIPLCGAGISSKKDIEEAKKIGCRGVVISSVIMEKKRFDILR